MPKPSPPNVLRCKDCARVWKAHGRQVCPGCASDQVRVECGAKTRSGKPCVRSPVAGGKRCRIHGGRGQLGIASPHFRTGEYSKLPQRYAEAFDHAAADPELLSLRRDAALLSARRAELIERLDTTESSARWKAVAKALSDAESARGEMAEATKARDLKAYGEAYSALCSAHEALSAAVLAGIAQNEQWAELVNLTKERRATVEAEVRRAAVEKTSLTAEQATAIIAVVATLIRKFLPDSEAYSAFAAELRQTIGLTRLDN